MTTALALRTGQLTREGAFEQVARANALRATGRHVVNLAIGEPDFPTPLHIREAGARSLRDGDTRYSAPEGLPELRAAIAESLGERGIVATPEQVVVTPGAKSMLFYAVLSLVAPGDEVLVPDPGFPTYASVVRFAGGRPIYYGTPAADGFAPDADEIARRITPRTRVLILNSPHNPSGRAADAAALARIAALAEERRLTVIADEIYARLWYGEGSAAPSIAALPGLGARTVVVDGFSKTYAMTGWRLGFGVMPAAIAHRVTTLAVNAHSCTPAFVQRAALAALTGPQDPVRAMVAEYRERRDLLVGGLNAIPGVRCAQPAGAFYAFPHVAPLLAAAGLTAADLSSRLLEEFGVAVLPGTAFGERGEGHLRLTFAASSSDLALALGRLRECVQSLPSC